MNITHPGLNLLEESFRWFGPNDPVPLSFIRQTGAFAVFTSLHQIPYGDLWPREEIRLRKEMIEQAGLVWTAVESVPVHESIKTGSGDLAMLFRNYRETLANLAAEGITTVIYNFMPALDWIRTDMRHVLPDGSECLLYDPVKFAAFDIYGLQRPGARENFTPDQVEQAGLWWMSLEEPSRQAFIQDIIDVFPGVKWGLSLVDIREMLAKYDGIGEEELFANMLRFLEAVVPEAEKHGIRLAVHPDDPPFPVLGLPRIVSREDQLDRLFSAVESPSNGVCFCTGSLSANPSNDLTAMVARFAPRIHAVHLRSTRLLADGSFLEDDHLGGSVDMPSVVRLLLDEQDRRRNEGRSDWRMAFRPDHGHTMMDDLGKESGLTPGYSCIGRMRGLAELRGLMLGLRHAELSVRTPSC
jgi:mannonate dehydratase